MTIQRGVCPVCTREPLLAPDGRLVFHSGADRGVTRPRCTGTGGLPVTDPAQLAALADAGRHQADADGRCRSCSRYRSMRKTGAPEGHDHAVRWPCQPYIAARAAFETSREARSA